MTAIHIIHENDEWMPPFRAAFKDQGLPFVEWHMDRGEVDLEAVPPAGVFYSRMSASSHTRGHRFAPELTGLVLTWLDAHGRRIVNDRRALALEVSKLGQYSALSAHGIRVPRTIAAVGREETLAAAKALGELPFILKPNRGGKGLGVQLFRSIEALAAYLDGEDAEAALVDGVWLVQSYIEPETPFITRCEFIGGRFLYAVQVDTSQGFLLCPADACESDEAFCPAPSAGKPSAKFEIIPRFEEPVIARYETFLKASGIEVAGIEFVRARGGEIFTYDVNTNTNYNADAEKRSGVPVTGPQALAQFLGAELRHQQRHAA